MQTPLPGRTVVFLAAQNSPKMEAVKTQAVVGVSTAQSELGETCCDDSGQFFCLVISAAGGKSGDFALSIGAPICLGKIGLNCREDE